MKVTAPISSELKNIKLCGIFGSCFFAEHEKICLLFSKYVERTEPKIKSTFWAMFRDIGLWLNICDLDKWKLILGYVVWTKNVSKREKDRSGATTGNQWKRSQNIFLKQISVPLWLAFIYYSFIHSLHFMRNNNFGKNLT